MKNLDENALDCLDEDDLEMNIMDKNCNFLNNVLFFELLSNKIRMNNNLFSMSLRDLIDK